MILMPGTAGQEINDPITPKSNLNETQLEDVRLMPFSQILCCSQCHALQVSSLFLYFTHHVINMSNLLCLTMHIVWCQAVIPPPPLPALCSLSRSKSILYMSVLHPTMIFHAFVKNTCNYVKRGKPTVVWKIKSERKHCLMSLLVYMKKEFRLAENN